MPVSAADALELAKAFRSLKPLQRAAIKSYVKHCVLGTLPVTRWFKMAEGTNQTSWYEWRTQERFARALEMYASTMEEQRIAAELQQQVEIARYEAQARYLVAQAKPLAAVRLAEITETASDREAVQAGKALLDYNTTPAITSSPDADLWRQAGEPVDTAPVEPAGEAPDDGSPSPD